MKSLTALTLLTSLSLSTVSWADAMPEMKYECVATIGQDNSPLGLLAKTKKFIVTNENYNEGITLERKDFSEVEDYGMPQYFTNSFDGTSLEDFNVWLTIRGDWNSQVPVAWKHLDLDASLSVGDISMMSSATVRPKAGASSDLETSSRFWPSNATDSFVGSIHLNVDCKDLLNAQVTQIP